MRILLVFTLAVFLAVPSMTWSQQAYRLPNLSSLKHITTRDSEHAKDVPGKETTMDFYSDNKGQVYTVYTYRGRTVAFSTHSNSDPEKTYRVFMDLDGNRLFQRINTGQWQIPAWARQ
jgi:hypothetical protein